MGNRKLWKCKDGRKIRIKDMVDIHLINTIKMLRSGALVKAYTTPFPNFNGEEAQACAESQYDLMLSDPVKYFLEGSIYDDLVEEAHRRKLEVVL